MVGHVSFHLIQPVDNANEHAIAMPHQQPPVDVEIEAGESPDLNGLMAPLDESQQHEGSGLTLL